MNVLFLHGSLHGQWVEIPYGAHHLTGSGEVYELHHFVGSDAVDRPVFVCQGSPAASAMDLWQSEQTCGYCGKQGHSEDFTACHYRITDAALYSLVGRGRWPSIATL